MKILHVIPSISSLLGGPALVALNLTHALQELGVDTDIVTTNFNGDIPLPVSLNQRVHYPIEGEGSPTVPIWFLPYAKPALKEFLFSPELTHWLWHHIHRYDVLDNHYLFSYAPTCAAAIARLKHIPYTVRTMGQLSPWALEQSRLKKQLYTHIVERKNLKKAAAIHCTTLQEANDVRQFGIQTPTVTLPLGVNFPTFHPNAKQRLRQTYGVANEVPVILFLSRLHYKKRPELLLESLKQLAQQNYVFHLIMAGSGEQSYLDKLKQLTISFDIADRVSFPGFVTGSNKDILLQGSDFFVLPSFSENFGIAVAEALIAKLPVVITPGIQIASDIERANAGIVVSNDLSSLTHAIARLLSSPELRQTLGQNGQQFAQARYTWKAIAKELVNVYTMISKHQKFPCDIAF
ncbi:MAG: glycosyltransferase [Leptolyngbyaceae bacterium]|nr:glycosyltransferase [Leptolyngbyaceae bacterium]